MADDTETSVRLNGQLELLRKDIASRIELMNIKVVGELEDINKHLDRLNTSVDKNYDRSIVNKEDIIKLQTDQGWADKLDNVVHDNMKEKQSVSDKRVEKLRDYLWKNSPTLGAGGGILFLIGKGQGWW